MSKKHVFEFLPLESQISLIESGSFVASNFIEGVKVSLYLVEGIYWVEVFYEEDEKTINFMSICPEIRLDLYLGGLDIDNMN